MYGEHIKQMPPVLAMLSQAINLACNQFVIYQFTSQCNGHIIASKEYLMLQ